MTPSESTVTSPKEESAPDSVISSPEIANKLSALNVVSDEDDAMLKLVAAHTPSHRGQWEKNGKRALRMIMGEDDNGNGHEYPSDGTTDDETPSINDEIGKLMRNRAVQGFALILT